MAAPKEATLPPFYLLGDRDHLAGRARALGSRIEFADVSVETACSAFPDALPVVSTGVKATAQPGKPDGTSAEAAIASIRQAVGDVVAGRAAAVVTNPIAKSVLYRAGFNHPGHTEFLAELAGQNGRAPQPVMMLWSPVLAVIPVTIHLALREAIEAAHQRSDRLHCPHCGGRFEGALRHRAPAAGDLRPQSACRSRVPSVEAEHGPVATERESLIEARIRRSVCEARVAQLAARSERSGPRPWWSSKASGRALERGGHRRWRGHRPRCARPGRQCGADRGQGVLWSVGMKPSVRDDQHGTSIAARYRIIRLNFYPVFRVASSALTGVCEYSGVIRRTHWCLRRLRRTCWLLGRKETRVQMLAYLAGEAAVRSLSLSRELVHRASRRRARMAHAR